MKNPSDVMLTATAAAAGPAAKGQALSSSIPEQSVLWDQSELKGRNCHACACYFESVNPADPTKFQGFCRRTPAQLVQLRGEVPRLDRNNQPVLKDGKPVMNSEIIPGYIYQVTQRDGTCFDGYRPKGTLPGEGPHAAVLRVLVPLMVKVAKKSGVTIAPEVDRAVKDILNLPLDDEAPAH